VFTNDPAVEALAVTALRVFSTGNICYAYGMVLTQAFNGAGDTLTPTVLNLICFWLVWIPLAYFLAFHTSLGARGVFVAVVAGDTLLAVLAMVWFRRGRWKSTVV
jgi:Na+-driven multidrug efflux pump